MSIRRAHRVLIGIAITWMVLVTIMVGWAVVRGENTRGITRASSVCTRAAQPGATQADQAACDRVRRQARLTEPLSDACIIQKRTLRSGWYQRVTKCPPMSVPTHAVRASP